jgi:hypothetical protein
MSFREPVAVSEIDRLSKNKIDNSICPFTPLPADWDSYLESRLSANTRQKVRRVLRQVEKSDELRITHADKDTFERDLEILLRFWTERWGSQKGLRLNSILKNNRLMLRHCFADGALFLPILWQGERPVGALAILVDARKKSFLFHMAGRDQTFESPPPGLVLHAHSIRHAIENGFVTYDFLRGNEPYKYSFGAEERRITSFIVATKDEKNLGGRLDRRTLPAVLRIVKQHQKAGRHAQAEAGLRQVLEAEPHNADALYGLGQALAKRGRHAAASSCSGVLAAAGHRQGLVLARTVAEARGEFSPAACAYARYRAAAGASRCLFGTRAHPSRVRPVRSGYRRVRRGTEPADRFPGHRRQPDEGAPGAQEAVAEGAGSPGIAERRCSRQGREAERDRGGRRPRSPGGEQDAGRGMRAQPRRVGADRGVADAGFPEVNWLPVRG